MILAVIPARGGSKRIPGKNIRSFLGKPIIQYSIEAAIKSEVFDRVIVSTDSEQIAAMARDCGAEIPFIRPAELSDDHTPTIPVIRHAVESTSTQESPVRFACCIYATAPFVEASDIRRGLDMLKENPNSKFLFPVTTFPFPILRSLRMDGSRVTMNFPEHEQTRSQDLTEAWHDAGQFYWGTATAWKSANGVYSASALGLPVERCRVQDIDTNEDWSRAELMYSALAKTT